MSRSTVFLRTLHAIDRGGCPNNVYVKTGPNSMVDLQRRDGKSVYDVLLRDRFSKPTSRDPMLDALYEVREVVRVRGQLFAQLKNKVRDPPVNAPDSYQTV